MLRRFIRSYERGQIVMMFALMIPIFAGMAGMAIDVGSYASDRRSLQNAADSMALAAAQDLPDAGKTQATALIWATKNNINTSDVTVSVTGGNVSPTVTVTVNRNHSFAFMKMVGIDSKSVGAKAAAIKASFGGGAGIVPWAVTQATVNQAGNGTVVTLKYDSSGVTTGNFGAMRIDGSGSSTYQDDAAYGSNSYACAQGTAGCDSSTCPGQYPNVCGETAPECDGPSCSSETGNMTGSTRDAVDFRMSHTSAACDTFEETFPAQNPDGSYDLNPDCNPWTNGPGHCQDNTSICSRRVIIIPVVDTFNNGTSTPSTVVRFALLYLEGYEGTCIGSSCEVQGRFVKADLTMNALAGVYDPTALVHFVRLTM